MARWILNFFVEFGQIRMCGWFYDIQSFYCSSVASEAPRIRAGRLACKFWNPIYYTVILSPKRCARSCTMFGLWFTNVKLAKLWVCLSSTRGNPPVQFANIRKMVLCHAFPHYLVACYELVPQIWWSCFMVHLFLMCFDNF